MLTFISCAKTMTGKTATLLSNTTTPQFMDNAKRIALAMSNYPTEELGKQLHVNPQIAVRTSRQFRSFLDENVKESPALLAYTGMVFKHIAPADFTDEDWNYAKEHLRITSFLYGLLRPTDHIRNYRLEGNIRLQENEGQTFFTHWRPLLTGPLIETVCSQNGVLVNLASAEMKGLFDWKRITNETRVVTPDFYTYHNGKLKTVTVYAKMCRGEMTRFILKNRIEDPEVLKEFEWEGYRFLPQESTDNHFIFALKT